MKPLRLDVLPSYLSHTVFYPMSCRTNCQHPPARLLRMMPPCSSLEGLEGEDGGGWEQLEEEEEMWDGMWDEGDRDEEDME